MSCAHRCARGSDGLVATWRDERATELAIPTLVDGAAALDVTDVRHRPHQPASADRRTIVKVERAVQPPISTVIHSDPVPVSNDFKDFLRLLGEHCVKYLVVGGYAVAVHAVPRYTKDLDVWIEASTENARRVVAALDAFGFASLGLTTDDFDQPDVVVQLGYEPNRIDILTGISGVRFEDAYPRRITTPFDEIEVAMIDKASLVTNKRATGRPRDLLDVQELEK